MGYVAVRGGGLAIEESLKLLEYERVAHGDTSTVEEIEITFPGLIEQVMGEASLYAPRLAALALKQAQGSPEEAVFLLRAFRSTLERPYVSRVIDTEKMQVERRISAAFKDVPGGQLLGVTRDYSHRLINFDLEAETPEDQARIREEFLANLEEACVSASEEALASLGSLPKVMDYLRSEGLSEVYEDDDTEPVDVTMEPLTFPAPRSARLQTLARGMTQGVTTLGYAAIRGFGPSHPTVGELRAGTLEILINNPLSEGHNEDDSYYIGSIPVTEVESVFSVDSTKNGKAHLSFEVGYGLVMGHLETKAIAMSVLDFCLNQGDKQYPTQDEEFVLYHVDGVEATGFVSHLKLPHYVTFQSKLSSVRSTVEDEDDSAADEHASCSAVEEEKE